MDCSIQSLRHKSRACAIRRARVLPGQAQGRRPRGVRAKGHSDMVKGIGLVRAGGLALALAHFAFETSPVAAQNTPSATTLVVAFGTDSSTLETAQNSSRDTSNILQHIF